MHASLGFWSQPFPYLLNGPKAYELECRRKYEQRMARKAARLQLPLAEVMKGSQVPGGSLHFNNEPSWLTEKGDMTEEMGPETKSDGKKQKKGEDKKDERSVMEKVMKMVEVHAVPTIHTWSR